MLDQFLSQFGYVAIAALLVGGGVGMPVPEELIQLTAGYLSRRAVLELPWAIAAAYGGIVAGDVLFFLIAQRHGDRLLEQRRVRRLLTRRRRAVFDRHFSRHAFLTIVVARHTSGFRLAAYALAATHGVRVRTFLLADALSALLSVPLVVSLGWYFAARIEVVHQRLHEVELGLAVAVALGIVGAFAWRRWRERRRAEEEEEEEAPPQR